jgi:hypothetical protein
MGCKSSKFTGIIGAGKHIDDSIHAMLRHDSKVARNHGEYIPRSYVPRQQHPLLQPVACCEEDDTEDSLQQTLDESNPSDDERLMVPAKEHNNRVESRDHSEQKGLFLAQ